MSEKSMIEVKNLSRHFGEIKAVNNISFKVLKGDVLGFLGPNGAGKSTTMRMLTSSLIPTSGTATINGFDVIKDSMQARRQVGYLPENAPVYSEMIVRDFLTFIASIRKVSLKKQKTLISEVIEKIHLESVINRRVDTLSKGFKRRVGLAQAVLHNPDILILDEPTDGLDPNQKHEIRELINNMRLENKCIILSTHILEEVEAVCNRVIIISDGEILVDETPEDLEKRARDSGVIELIFKSLENNDLIVSSFKDLNSVKEVYIETNKNLDTFLRIYPDKENFILSDVLKKINDSNLEVKHLSVKKGELDEVFREITQKK